MTNAELNKKVEQMQNLEAAVKLIQSQIDNIKEELKAELDSRKVDSVNTDLYNIFYNMYEKTTVDTTKLKDSGLYEEYSKKSVVLQFKVTDKKAG